MALRGKRNIQYLSPCPSACIDTRTTTTEYFFPFRLSVHAVNSHFHRTILCYTFDAGPNAFLFFPATEAFLVRSVLCHTFRLDQRDSNQVRGITTPDDDASSMSVESDLRSFEDNCEGFSLLRGKAKFLIFTQPGPGPRVLEEN